MRKIFGILLVLFLFVSFFGGGYYLYQKSDTQFSILHAMDGYDEISLTGATKVLSNQGERM